MSPEDIKRLSREADLAAATRGGNYSAYHADVAAEKNYYAKLRAAAGERLRKISLLRQHHPSELGDEDGGLGH